jgi:aconitase A
MARELVRNGERYRFMKWATAALDGVRVHPPGTGIMHTLNLERIARRYWKRDSDPICRCRSASAVLNPILISVVTVLQEH